MSAPNLRDLCQQFIDAVDQLASHGDSPNGPGHRLILTVDVDHLEELANNARNELAKPLTSPGNEEAEAWADGRGFIKGSGDHPCGFWVNTDSIGPLIRAALLHWGLTADAQAAADAELEGVCSTILSQKWFCDPTHRIAQLRRARRPATAIPLEETE